MCDDVENTVPCGCEVDRCGEVEADNSVSSEMTTTDQDAKDIIIRLPKGLTLPDAVQQTPEQISYKCGFWRDYLRKNKIIHIVAPMVDQSELAFRMFLRSHEAHLTFTPMIHAHLFVNDQTYRRNALALCPADRPLIVQFCANKPETLLAACRLVEGFCDGVDLNLGCPQMVAKRGHYGSYLQDEVDLICSMVSAVRDYCTIPISCKIRIRDCPEQTIQYAERLVDAGATMLTVHGRTRDMRGADTGVADWGRIRQVVHGVSHRVPVVANGNIQMAGDIGRCLEQTDVVAVMSAEGILYNPLLFEYKLSSAVAAEYLQYAKKYNAGVSAMRAHIFRICHHSLLEYADLRHRLSTEHLWDQFQAIVEELQQRQRVLADSEEGRLAVKAAEELFENIRLGETVMDPVQICRTPHWLSKPYFRLPESSKELITKEGEKSYKEQKKEELLRISTEKGISIKQAKKRERRKILEEKSIAVKKMKFPCCARCSQPAGQGCALSMCKRCCKFISKRQRLDCNPHRSKWSHLPPIDSCLIEGVVAEAQQESSDSMVVLEK